MPVLSAGRELGGAWRVSPRPRVHGHEYTATVVAIGDNVDPAWLGRQVTGDSLVPCNRCGICDQGSPNECGNGGLIGLELPGVFANYATVPASTLHSLKPLQTAMQSEALIYGCLAEPLGVATKPLCEALRILPRRAIRSLLIHGAGPIGVGVGLVGRVLGFNPIVLIEPLSARRETAASCGLCAVGVGELHEKAFADVFGVGAAVVVDACGAVDSADLLKGTRPAGVMVCLARTGRELALPQDDLMTRGIKLIPSRGHVGYLPRVLRWIGEGRIDPRPMVTRRLFGLQELLSWLQRPERFNDECKVVCQISTGGLPCTAP